MQTTGFQSPRVVVDDPSYGSVTWLTPENAAVADDAYATVTTNNASSHYLKATNFGFNVPPNMAITGVLAEIQEFADVLAVKQDQFRLVLGGLASGNNKATSGSSFHTTKTTIYIGGPAFDVVAPDPSLIDMWGNTLTPTIVNASDFGFALASKTGFFQTGTLSIDRIRLAVFYDTQPSATPPAASASAICIDDDTLQAMRAVWNASATLPALVDEPPKAGRLKSPQRLPYAKITSALARRNLVGVDGPFFDYRKVTIQIWGLKADVSRALATIAGVFNRNTVLVYPSGARFQRWDPQGVDKLEQDPATKGGEDIWLGTHEAEVWSQR